MKTPRPKKLTFGHADKIRELARRGEAWGNLESKQALEHAIEMGRGGGYLRLTPKQCAQGYYRELSGLARKQRAQLIGAQLGGAATRAEKTPAG